MYKTVLLSLPLAVLLSACAGPSRLSGQPKFIVAPRLQAAGVTFGAWQDETLVYVTTMEVSQGGEEVPADAVKVKCKGKGGLVMKDGFARHAAVKPGEKTKIEIFPRNNKDEIESITLDLGD